MNGLCSSLFSWKRFSHTELSTFPKRELSGQLSNWRYRQQQKHCNRFV